MVQLVYLVAWLSCSANLGVAIDATRYLQTHSKSRRYFNVNLHECKASLGSSTWGIWIDGKNAAEGPDAYGKSYTDTMAAALKDVYHMLAERPGELKLSHFEKIASLIDASWRISGDMDPIATQVKDCQQTALPHTVSEAVQNGIVVVDKEYHPALLAHNVTSSLETLFNMYNSKLAVAKSARQQLTDVGWLMRNLAFMHPLVDRNGRSRLLLLQFELRRLNIACGTMLWNNNKDIYFETLDTYVAKLKEGIDAYKEADKSGNNPWQQESFATIHNARFSTPFKERLERCWARWCSKNPACKGTSPSL
eukprot:gnl/MRDRNA2_/MRDRNA2_108187_c0_seq1.p1 gnl/MRDRNA2_/MRDRNA2_108187_c0~~gnl/MRDRNA2_/MRDRNA2_108187_c0_seq1.p1  ORF type:complete len:308 (-),score=61.61 gnl/MRDRNA2_/MRDRNA2_108187_c0_seq1:272-1195(-)